MFIHFAFSSLKNAPDKQLEAVISNILKKKRLKYGVNPEFIPVFQPHCHPRFAGKKVVGIPFEKFKPSNSGSVADLNDLKPTMPQYNYYFLSDYIYMLCFINISFEFLSKSPHSLEYGKFGFVFSENFLNKNDIAAVQYYEETHLCTDPLVKEWNIKYAYKNNNSLTPVEIEEKKEIERQILAFRKPATLFKSFSESRLLEISKRSQEQTSFKIVDAYERYPIDYDFRKEKEWRIVSQEKKDFLSFTEEDLSTVIAPNDECVKPLKDFFDSNWNVRPGITIFDNSV